MNNYYIRKARHRCQVPGCRSTEVNRITKMKDSTKAVFICDECARTLRRSFRRATPGRLSGAAVKACKG